MCLSNGHTHSSVSRKQLSGFECVMWMNVSLNMFGDSDFFFDTVQSVLLKSAVM